MRSFVFQSMEKMVDNIIQWNYITFKRNKFSLKGKGWF